MVLKTPLGNVLFAISGWYKSAGHGYKYSQAEQKCERHIVVVVGSGDNCTRNQWADEGRGFAHLMHTKSQLVHLGEILVLTYD